MSSEPERAEDVLERARATRDDLEARLLLAAAVAKAGLEVGVRVVLTGGTAADFYASGTVGTSAAYPALWRASADVDVVVLAIGRLASARDALLQRLEALGLEPMYVGGTARVVDVPELPFLLELVDDELGSRGRDERTMTVLLDGRDALEVRSPENVVLAYAESGWHLRHYGDWTRALAVYAAMRDRIDHAWMRDEAARRGQAEALARIERQEPLR